MTKKDELLEFIKNLTPEQVDKIVSRKDLLERCLSMTPSQAAYTDTLTGKLFGV